MFQRIPHAAQSLTAKRMIAFGLSFAMLATPLGGGIQAARAQAPVSSPNSPAVNGPALPPSIPVQTPVYGAPSILLFPFSNDTTNATYDRVAAQVNDALKLRLNSVGSYKVTSYTKFLPSVQRAVDDSVLTQTDLVSPFDPQKAGKIATQVGTNDYLTGGVESVTADPTTRKVTIEVSADLRNTQTGSSLRTLAFTGTAAPISNTDTLDMVTQRAVDAVASKLAAALNEGHQNAMIVPASQRGHSSAGAVVLLTLLTGALLYAILHNSGSGSGSSNSGIINGSGSGSTTTTTTGGPPAPPGVS